ncbi:MAG: hypothetical protein NVSMB57_09160 [Actinomycetota bacterium]
MKKRALFAATILAMALGASSGHAGQPSTRCGAGSSVTGSPDLLLSAGYDYVIVCPGNGSLSPSPVQGAFTLWVSGNGTSYIDFSGNSTNTTPIGNCSRGYMRLAANGSGPQFYESTKGGYTAKSRSESPDVWVLNIAHHCSGL